MAGLALIDAWAIAAILSKSMEYGAALLALGGPLFVVAFREAPEDVLRLARALTVAAAVLCIALLVLRFGIRSARISGLGVAGMIDKTMLGLIWDSPLGSAAVIRASGTVFVLVIAFRSAPALVGSVLIAASYTQVGHSLGDPRWVLAVLLTVHLLAAGFWVAALAPLHRVAAFDTGGAVLDRFGAFASFSVPLMVAVGLVFACVMTGSLVALVSTAYGWTLLAKVTFFAGLLSLAALNKLRLVPAIVNGNASGIVKLRLSIWVEAGIVLLILLVTATLTTVTTPPINL